MKYIFITYAGLSYPIADKLQKEGAEVTVGLIGDIQDYVPEEEIATAHEENGEKKKRLEMYKGILEISDAKKVVETMKKIKDPHNYFVFFEENNLYRWADQVKDLGFEGNFPTKEDYMFEVDREKAKRFVKENYPKLEVPEVKNFGKVEDAINFLSGTEDIWVLKGKNPEAKSFIPDSVEPDVAREQVKEFLTNYKDKYELAGFVLELYIPSLIELTPEKIYYDGIPLGVNLDIENKPLGAGNISVQTGCSEDLVFPISMNDRISKIAFPEVVDKMAREHKGLFIWDASLLINKKTGKMYFGEFCSNRPGYNSIFTELAQTKSVNSYFESLVHKISPLPMGTVGVSVRVFNLNRDERTGQYASCIAISYKPEIERNLWLWDAKKDESGRLVNVGSDWNFAVVTECGEYIDDAVNRLYKNIEGLSFIGAYFRPKDDFFSLDYLSSMLSRLNYGLERGLYNLPFKVKVGKLSYGTK